MSLKSLSQIHNITGKTVLVRVDFNVPLKNSKVVDNSRIAASLPTIRFLQKRGVKNIILISHLGRPEGSVVKGLSLKPVARELEELLRQKVVFCELDKVAEKSGLILVENIRFFKEEEIGDKKFARRLAGLADFFINDAFSASHSSASLVTIAKYLPAYAGLDLEQEIYHLRKLINNIKKPAVAVIGGAKVADKLPVITFLAKHFDKVLVGGVVANTFLKALGVNIGRSLYDESMVVEAKKIYKKHRGKIVLPIDVIVDVSGTRRKETTLVDIGNVKSKHCIYDVGPLTANAFAEIIKKSKTVFWAGPLGNTDEKIYSHSTLSVGRVASARARGQAVVVVGGGDSAAFFHENKMWFDYYSTAGGALLKFLSGEVWPALKVLGYK